MTDEKFLFVPDVKDKKRTARGSRNKSRGAAHRTVRMPSDYLTEKERKSLNGEVVSYNLKQPMKWAAYKALPDDIQREYIERLHRLYQASNQSLATMLGVSTTTVVREQKRLGVEPLGKGHRVSPEWQSFVKYGTPSRESTAVKDLVPAEIREKLEQYEAENPRLRENVERCKAERSTEPTIVPDTGDIRIKGTVKSVGKTLEMLLGDREVSFRISWDLQRTGNE